MSSYPDRGEEPPLGPPRDHEPPRGRDPLRDRDDRSDDRPPRRRRRSRSWSRSPRRDRSRSRSPRRYYRERSYSPSPDGRRYDRYRGPPHPRDYPPRGPFPPGPPDDFRYRDYPPPPPPYGDPYFRGPPGPPPPHHHHRGPPPNMPRRGDRGERRRDEGPPGVSLLIRNVSPEVTTQELQSAFSRIGEIRDVYIPRDYYSNQPKGFAFIEYASANMAADARDEMDRFVIRGRELEVVFAQERRKTPNEMRGRVVNQHNRSAPEVTGGPGGGGRGRGRSSSFERHQRREREERDRDGTGGGDNVAPKSED